MAGAPGIAESLLQQRASQIMKIQPPHAPPSGSLENIIDAQSTFNALFVNILKLDSTLSEASTPTQAAAGSAAFAFGGFPTGAAAAAVAPPFSPTVKRSFSDNVLITREVMDTCTPDLLALFTDSSLSATASKSLSRFVKLAASKLMKAGTRAIFGPSVEPPVQVGPAFQAEHSFAAAGGAHVGTPSARSPVMASPSLHGSLASSFSAGNFAGCDSHDDAAALLSPASLFSIFTPRPPPKPAVEAPRNVFNDLIDETALWQRLRTQLALTPHRAGKLRSMIRLWAQHGVPVADSQTAQTLVAGTTLGQLQHAVQQPCSVSIDDGALKDILVALEKFSSRSLGELGVFSAVGSQESQNPFSSVNPFASITESPGGVATRASRAQQKKPLKSVTYQSYMPYCF
jgi:hypothetical protein